MVRTGHDTPFAVGDLTEVPFMPRCGRQFLESDHTLFVIAIGFVLLLTKSGFQLVVTPQVVIFRSRYTPFLDVITEWKA